MPPKKIREAAGPNFAYQGKIPENFSFVDSEWEKWLRTFERYRKVSRLFAEPEDIQVSTLILTMGTKAETILETFNLSIREEESYDSVIQSFNKYFAKKINVIYERAKFNRRYQFENEPVSEFITSLQELSMSCKYGPLREELLRDRIVVESSCSNYARFKGELTVHEGLVMRGKRIVVPRTLRPTVLGKLHDGHLGITKCQGIAKETVWWPGINEDIRRKVTECFTCVKTRNNPTSPMISTDFPALPWSMVGLDLFSFNQQNYLALQDYYSRYLEIVGPLRSITSSVIVKAVKKIFSRFGFPHTVRCDNGTQLCSEEMKRFANESGFEIVTSSPRYPRSNGLAESAVDTAKRILSKCEDVDMGLLSYRTAPLENGYSPAELLMGRKLRGLVPIKPENLIPAIPDQDQLREKERQIRLGRKAEYDRRHGARELPELQPGDQVWVQDMREVGTIKRKLPEPHRRSLSTPTSTNAEDDLQPDIISSARVSSSLMEMRFNQPSTRGLPTEGLRNTIGAR
ncbi:unnamed protein product [Nesidiocoris tenuis]|uniref:RNA-directed DNA polymerase n=1 Tax=Nesidiocoris tenuis TaxID=355587 RepID=A0A6H5HVC0_9HEMI|nr:unnamed protein product [Nesidiocoris tenuis]CAB0019154.1 unnamed protein product [Nesidiocoris tenuis]